MPHLVSSQPPSAERPLDIQNLIQQALEVCFNAGYHEFPIEGATLNQIREACDDIPGASCYTVPGMQIWVKMDSTYDPENPF